MVVTHPSHPLSKRKQVQLVDLEAEPFILFAKNFALHDRIIMDAYGKDSIQILFMRVHNGISLVKWLPLIMGWRFFLKRFVNKLVMTGSHVFR